MRVPPPGLNSAILGAFSSRPLKRVDTLVNGVKEAFGANLVGQPGPVEEFTQRPVGVRYF